ncbi:hypothetical protein Goshw_029771, partial [Gossypium schwendimanii]|nr:hypothetical protein [Gossypium schwendimanii]
MLPKIKIFSWRVGHNILPTLDNIARICQGINNICPRCNNSEETLIHVMKDCPKTREILVAGGLNNSLLNRSYINCIDWLEDAFRVLDNKSAADFLTLLWNSWNDRNNMVFKGKMDAPVIIWERAQTLSKDFRIYNLTEPAVLSTKSTNRNWKKPPNGSFKINVDATISNGCRGVGAIARDHDGFVIGGCYNFKEKAMDITWAELDAFKEGLKLAERLKINSLIVESDCAMMVNAVKRRRTDISILGQCVRKECDAFSKFESVQVNWTNRNSNYAADFLCNLAIRNKKDLYFDMEYPSEIHNIIIQDVING